MKRVAMMSAAVAVLWSVGTYAQGRNFSGTWTIDSERTMSAAPAGVVSGGGGSFSGGSGGAATVARATGSGGGVGGGFGAAGGAVMASGGSGGGMGGGFSASGSGTAVARVSSSVTIAMDANNLTVGSGDASTSYHLDGTPTTSETARGTAVATASWRGDKLQIETKTQTANGTTTSLSTWYLEGDALVRETSAITTDGTQSTPRKTYFKR